MMKNLKISTRLILSYMIIVALMVVTSIVAVIMLSQVGGALQNFYEEDYASVKNIVELQRDLRSVESAMTRALVELNHNSPVAAYVSQAEESFASAEVNVEALLE